MSNNKLVYSTEVGRIQAEKPKPEIAKGDGIVRIQRQTSGRNGKTVSVISGLALEPNQLKQLVTELKKSCGCGGSIKDSNIVEIQGEKRDLIKQLLEKKGYTVKLAGG